MRNHSNPGSWSLAAVLGVLPFCAVRAQDAPAPSSTPQAQSGVLPGRLSDVEGSVRIASAPQMQPAAATPGGIPAPPADTVQSEAQLNMPVLPGAVVETGGDGKAEIQFADGSVARLTPDSAAQLTAVDSGGERLRAESGLTYYEIPGRSSGQMTVGVGGYKLTGLLNSLVRVDMDARPYQIAALRGTVQVQGAASNQAFTLDEGQSALLDRNSPGGYQLQPEAASVSWDQWNADRDDALDQLAQGQTSARDGNGSSDADAWDDLDYYGSWYDVPGSGEVWSPDGVDEDFDPYGDGDWDYYNGVGYIWISAYPWGWLPYHCGNWNYFTGFGWGWQPIGGCGLYGGAGWYPYAGVSHAPYGYRLPGYGAVGRRPFRNHLGGVPIGPVQPVHRAPLYQYRGVGGTRPEPRSFPLADRQTDAGNPVYARTLPVIHVPVGEPGAAGMRGGVRPAYRPERGAMNGAGSTAASGSTLANPRVPAPEPRFQPPTPRTYTPPPRVETAAPHAEAPHSEPAPARPR